MVVRGHVKGHARMECLVKRDVLHLLMRRNFVTNPHVHSTPHGNDQNAVQAVVVDSKHSQEVARIYLKVLKTFVLKKLSV